jgi:hypothetical protein
MSKRKVRHLISKPGRDGLRRFYWQPSAELRAKGWLPERLPDEYEAALARAEALNRHLDQVRRRSFVGPPLREPGPRRFPRGRRPQGGSSGIYVVGAGDGEPMKIGIAVDVAGRLLQLQVGSSKRLRILLYLACRFEDAVAIEREVLTQMASRKVSGEWLACAPEELVSFVLLLFSRIQGTAELDVSK